MNEIILIVVVIVGAVFLHLVFFFKQRCNQVELDIKKLHRRNLLGLINGVLQLGEFEVSQDEKLNLPVEDSVQQVVVKNEILKIGYGIECDLECTKTLFECFEFFSTRSAFQPFLIWREADQKIFFTFLCNPRSEKVLVSDDGIGLIIRVMNLMGSVRGILRKIDADPYYKKQAIPLS